MAGRIFAVIIVSPAYSVVSVAGDGGPRAIWPWETDHGRPLAHMPYLGGPRQRLVPV